MPTSTLPSATKRPAFFFWALSSLFFLPALVIASWASRLPAIRDALHLTPGEIGAVLFCLALGAIIFFPCSSWLIAHFGARRCTLFAGLWVLLMLPCIALAPTMLTLMLVMASFGAAMGVFDVAINMIGSKVEKAAGRSIMSALHAWFCAGILAGSLFGSAMASLLRGPIFQFTLVSLLMAAVLLWVVRVLPSDQPDPSVEKRRFALPHGPVMALGVVGFCAAIAEGSIGDWSGIYLRDHLHAPEWIAALAIAVFSGAMLLARLVCDRLKDRFGARYVVAVGALISACGLLLAVLALDVPLALLGFAMSGAGLAAVFPFIFSAAGVQGGNALVSVTTMSYSGGLIGPPVIGLISDSWGVQMGMAFVGGLSLAVACAAWWASALRD